VDRAADFQPEAVDVEAAVRRAISQRTDIEIAKKNVEANDVTLKYLKNQTLPQTDFVVLYGANGVAGTQYKNTGTLNAAREIVSVSGFGSAFNQLFARDVPRWTVALNLSYPLGLSAQQASVARARVQLNQVQAQLKQQELQVATEVTNAAITVQSNSERVQAAQAARDLADQQLKAENSKFEVGMSTNYFVVQAQQQLAAAQNNELQAILNYRKSIVELERLQQTTLQNLNVTVVGR
jgi:outer membrane protein TolC